MISDLPRDVAEEVFSRVPLTSLRGFRSTCKSWNKTAKDRSFNKKYIDEAKVAVVMLIDFWVYLMDLKFPNIFDPSINRRGKLVDSDRFDISLIYHCDGLFLCIPKYFESFVVWNPYTCQTRWFKPRICVPKMASYIFALGYEKSKSCSIHKILRFVDCDIQNLCSYEIYELNSNSWRILDVASDWKIKFCARGVSLEGNTYWFARDKYPGKGNFFICFDFTQEKFGPRLPLPFQFVFHDTVTISSVRDKQLAVLFQPWYNSFLEIWVTTTLEPDMVAWNKFLVVDTQPNFQFIQSQASFFIDQENKFVVVFDKDRKDFYPCHNVAYFIGEDGYTEKSISENLQTNMTLHLCAPMFQV